MEDSYSQQKIKSATLIRKPSNLSHKPIPLPLYLIQNIPHSFVRLQDRITKLHLDTKTRSAAMSKLVVPCVKTTTHGLHSFRYASTSMWNAITKDQEPVSQKSR